jgi:outer membrane murein-binding lipoprotein Lpp
VRAAATLLAAVVLTAGLTACGDRPPAATTRATDDAGLAAHVEAIGAEADALATEGEAAVSEPAP